MNEESSCKRQRTSLTKKQTRQQPRKKRNLFGEAVEQGRKEVETLVQANVRDEVLDVLVPAQQQQGYINMSSQLKLQSLGRHINSATGVRTWAFHRLRTWLCEQPYRHRSCLWSGRLSQINVSMWLANDVDSSKRKRPMERKSRGGRDAGRDARRRSHTHPAHGNATNAPAVAMFLATLEEVIIFKKCPMVAKRAGSEPSDGRKLALRRTRPRTDAGRRGRKSARGTNGDVTKIEKSQRTKT